MPEAIALLDEAGTLTIERYQISDELFEGIVELIFTNWEENDDWQDGDTESTSAYLYFDDDANLIGWCMDKIVHGEEDWTWRNLAIIDADSFGVETEEEARECDEIVIDLGMSEGFESRAEVDKAVAEWRKELVAKTFADLDALEDED